jgi:hypothetical protein
MIYEKKKEKNLASLRHKSCRIENIHQLRISTHHIHLRRPDERGDIRRKFHVLRCAPTTMSFGSMTGRHPICGSTLRLFLRARIRTTTIVPAC